MSLPSTVREYRWELWLFLGPPIVAWIAELLFLEAAVRTESLISIGAYSWYRLTGDIASLVVLGGSYPWVRRLDRPVLIGAWQLVMALQGVAVLMTGLLVLATEPRGGWLYGLLWIAMLPSYLILVLYLRKMSRHGFDKSLILVAVALSAGVVFPSVWLSMHLPDLYPWVWTLWEVGGVSAQVILGVLVIRALHRSDAGTLGKGGLVSALGVSAVIFAIPIALRLSTWATDSELDSVIVEDVVVSYLFAVFVPLALYGLAALLAYALSVRPPRPEEPPVEFEGLYR